jgi:hypothetical protein
MHVQDGTERWGLSAFLTAPSRYYTCSRLSSRISIPSSSGNRGGGMGACLSRVPGSQP